MKGWQLETTTVRIQEAVDRDDRERLFHTSREPSDGRDRQLWQALRMATALKRELRPEALALHDPPTAQPDMPMQYLCMLVETLMGRIMKERNIGGIFHQQRSARAGGPETPPTWPAFSPVAGDHNGETPTVPFTNPLHHYVDQVNHRMVKSWLKREPAPFSGSQLASLSISCAWRERLKTAAEHAVGGLNHILKLAETETSMVSMNGLERRCDFVRTWLPDSGITVWSIADGKSHTRVSVDRLVPDLDLPKLPRLDLRP